MNNPVYNLPKLYFTAGSDQEFRFNLYREKGQPFYADDCSAVFSVVSYNNKMGIPLLTKPATLSSGSEGNQNKFVVSLSPEDTAGFSGWYIYQLTVVDNLNNIKEIPGRGILDIIYNFDN